jgi:hypothetical protein
MALNPSGAISLAGPSAGQSIAVELGLSATAAISLNDVVVRTLAQVPSGVIVMPTDFYGKSNFVNTQRAIFGFGRFTSSTASSAGLNTTNLVSNTGVVATDGPGVGSARASLTAAGYGGDKAIFGFGRNNGPSPTTPPTSITNLVSNTGVVASDTPGVGQVRSSLAAAGYGGDKAIFGFGDAAPLGPGNITSLTNLVSNTGVVASDTPSVGSARSGLTAAGYGGDKALFIYGARPYSPAINYPVSNLVSNTGVVASDTPIAGTFRGTSATGYGGDKAMFAFGSSPVGPFNTTNIINLISNTGVVASDTPGVGTALRSRASAGYGGDKAIFGYGARTGPNNPPSFNLTNLVSNTGVVASDSPGVGTARYLLACAGYSTT